MAKIVTEGIKQLVELLVEIDKLKGEFIKQLLIVASALFGILVSLHRNGDSISHHEPQIAYWVFRISLAALSLGILLLSIALYDSISLRRQAFEKQRIEEMRRLQDPQYIPLPVSTKSKWYFVWAWRLGCGSLALSLILLAVYSFYT